VSACLHGVIVECETRSDGGTEVHLMVAMR
jgi:hypothetical protein